MLSERTDASFWAEDSYLIGSISSLFDAHMGSWLSIMQSSGISSDGEASQELIISWVGWREALLQVHTATLCEVWQITLLKTSVQKQGNPLITTADLPGGSTECLNHSLTADKSFPETFMENVPPHTPQGMQVHLETLKQEHCINFRHDALPHFTM